MSRKKLVFVEKVNHPVLPAMRRPLEEILKQKGVERVTSDINPFHHHSNKRGFEIDTASYDVKRQSLKVKCYCRAGQGQEFYILFFDVQQIKPVIEYILNLNRRYEGKF